MSDWNPRTDPIDNQVEAIICDVLCDSGSVNPQPIQFTRNKVRARINALLAQARKNREEPAIPAHTPKCTCSDCVGYFLRETAPAQPRELLEQVATYLETLQIEHSPDCSYGATNGPDGDYCDCGLRARSQKRLDTYALIRAALAPAPAAETGKESK